MTETLLCTYPSVLETSSLPSGSCVDHLNKHTMKYLCVNMCIYSINWDTENERKGRRDREGVGQSLCMCMYGQTLFDSENLSITDIKS